MLEEIRAEEGGPVARGRILAHAVGVEEEPRAEVVPRVMRLATE
jgi:hypothetical protein